MYCVYGKSRSSLLIESTDSMIYMLGAKYGFVQSMNCAAQTMDPYFARAIHVLRSHSLRYIAVRLECDAQSVHVHGLYKPASQLALHRRPVVYPRTGPAREPSSLPEPKAKGCGDAAWTETGSLSSFSGLLLNGRQKAARW